MGNQLGKIYVIKNKLNDSKYIGCTINSIEQRFAEHIYRCFKLNYKSKLYNSIKKYGKDNFVCELLEECEIDKMYEKEKEYIEKLNTFNKGMNSTVGGEGCLGYTHSAEIRNKISDSLKSGKSHKGKKYEDIYGESSEIEKQKRSSSVKKSWDNLSEEQKKERNDKMRLTNQQKSKYGIDFIKELKNKINEGLDMKNFKILYPNIRKNLYYELKNGYRWNKI